MAWPMDILAPCPECGEALSDPYWCADCEFGPGPPFSGEGSLYHVAPVALREQIRTEGLQVGPDPGWGDDQAPGVYMWTSLDSAEAWRAMSSTAKGTDLEIWEIDGEELYPLHHDFPGSRICGGAVFCTAPIAPGLIGLISITV